MKEDSPQNSRNHKRHIREKEVRNQKSEVRMNAEGFYSVSCILSPVFLLSYVVFAVNLFLTPTLVVAQSGGAKGPGGKRDLDVKELKSGTALDGRGKLWAVVIGVSNYKNLGPKDQLEFAHRDAAEFADFLRSPNGGGFPSNQLTLLTNQAATLSAMRSALGTMLPRSAEPDDMVIIFFAGHGVVEGERDGYLLAHDSDPQNLYATALQVSELNRIVNERLKARTVILITDACHAGQLGWTSRNTGEAGLLVNRYLDEVGKSGKGVFRLLASRADQLSYEDKRFGGGHGCFTWFLLEGLRGKAERDGDGFVRVGELLDYLSENVPKTTQALQHPRAAGDIDVRLPLSVLSTAPARVAERAASSSPAAMAVGETASPLQTVVLEVQGVPGHQVYVDGIFRGRVLQNGVLVIEQLKPGEHDLSIRMNVDETIDQKLSLNAARTILSLKGIGSDASPRAAAMVAQIKHALNGDDVSEALKLCERLIEDSPGDPRHAWIESTLSGILESIGQKAINDYVQSSGLEIKRGMYHQAAEAFRLVRLIQPDADRSVEAKQLFCDGRARIRDGLYYEAVDRLTKAVALDSRAAYAYNALGVAYRELKMLDRAVTMLERAGELAPAWSLPRIYIGLVYEAQAKSARAEAAYKQAARLDPRNYIPHQCLSHFYVRGGRFKEAEREADIAIKMNPDDGYSYLILGKIYQATRRWSLAVNAYEKGMSLSPRLDRVERAAVSSRLLECQLMVEKERGRTESRAGSIRR
jgi:tetratricopeptide (TPR) repeat protein/uncharacterized caspase-like protein